MLEASLARTGIPIRKSGATVFHTGYSDPEVIGRKAVRNFGLALMEIGDQPDLLITARRALKLALALGEFETGREVLNHLLLKTIKPGDEAIGLWMLKIWDHRQDAIGDIDCVVGESSDDSK